MPEAPFIITVDTEGDDLWARPREITTRNAEYLPRFKKVMPVEYRKALVDMEKEQSARVAAE